MTIEKQRELVEKELRESEDNYTEEEIQFYLSLFLHCPEWEV